MTQRQVLAVLVILSYFLFFNSTFNLKNCNTYIIEKSKFLLAFFNKNGVSKKVKVDGTKQAIARKKINIYIIMIILCLIITAIYFSIPKICECLINNSITSIYAGKSEKAMQYIEIAKFLSHNNTFSNNIYEKGLEELDKNNMSNAEAFMNMTLKMEPSKKTEYSKQLLNKSLSAITNKQYAKSKKLSEYAVKFDKENTEKKKSDISKKYINSITAKKYEEALAYAEILILISPNDEHAYTKKGASLYFLNKHKETVEILTKAINIRNNYTLAYIDRANAYIRLKEYDKALYDCNKVIELSNDTNEIARAKYFLAMIYMKKNQYRKAMNEAFAAKDLFYNLGSHQMYEASYNLFWEAADAECTYGTYCY